MKHFLFATIFLLIGCSLTSNTRKNKNKYRSCRANDQLQKLRSDELQLIVTSDQNDRKDMFSKTQEEIQKIVVRDVERRKRVGEIFGEGCFKKAQDFAAAALVYQHGDTPEHYFQAFIWAKQAVALGDKSQSRLMSLAIDRYLVNIGHRQLFASQANKSNTENPESCWCLQQVEKSFPDKVRSRIAGKSLSASFKWLSTLNKKPHCPNVECSTKLKATPKGTIPGFW